MKFYLQNIVFFLFLTSLVQGQDTKVDILLEKVQQSKTKEDKSIFLNQLKLELARINQKARDESNAIIEAKKKLPTKLFNEKNLIK